MPEPAPARELLIAQNPDHGSRLPFLMRLPMTPPVVLRTAGTWPREKALFCYPVAAQEWPAEPDSRTTTRPRLARPPTAQVRAWARSVDLIVPDRGRLRPEVWAAWLAAHNRARS